MSRANSADPHNLQRFVDAQEHYYEQAMAEICAGKKRSHWMWFVFPQIDGLGRSPTSRQFAIKNRSEAECYLAHPVLGPRLIECCEALLAQPNDSAHDVFEYPDDLKLRSSMTLFARTSPSNPIFQKVLDRFFGGSQDERTIQLLATGSPPDSL